MADNRQLPMVQMGARRFGCTCAQLSGKPNPFGFRSPSSLSDHNHHALSFGETANTGCFKNRDVDEYVFTSSVSSDETVTPLCIKRLHLAEFLDGRRFPLPVPSGGRNGSSPVNIQHIYNQWPSVSSDDTDLESRAWLHSLDPGPDQHVPMKEGITRPIRQFNKSKPSLRVEPFDDGIDWFILIWFPLIIRIF